MRCAVPAWCVVFCLGLAGIPSATADDQSRRTFHVVHYDATVEPGIADKTVTGRVALDILTGVATATIELDIGALTVDSVAEAGSAAHFTQSERKLRVDLRPPARVNETRRIEVAYHGAPRFGLQFVPEKSQVYTIFSTSQWMPCLDAPSDRATLDLTLVLPRGLGVVANGRAESPRSLPDGRVAHHWRLDRPAPTFSFGFAAAPFNETVEKRGKVKLRYLSTEASAEPLHRIFVDTLGMIAFFENRSGVRYPEAAYSQALVSDTVGQEMSGFSLMSDEYGREVLADPQRIGLIAHELAHQWWGIGLTCEDWTHFWLNEGFATFMAAAYREEKFGRDIYMKDVENWRARYERVRAAGKDRSLAFPDWNHPTSDDRALVYQKGALVLHQLRDRLGDRVFWDALRSYTKTHFGKSVTTPDLQRAMEKSSGLNLTDFFDEWVYLSPRPSR